MVSTFYPPFHYGGDATYIRALSRALVARGHEVDVVHCKDAYRTITRHSPVVESVEDDGVVVHDLTSPFGLLSPLLTQQTGRPGFKGAALKKILARDFDVVNFHNISLVGGPAILGLSNAPVTLYTLHEHWLLCPTHIFWKNKSHACDKKQCLRCSLRSGIPPQIWRQSSLIKKSLMHVDALLAASQYTANRHQQDGIAADIRHLPLFSVFDEDEPADYIPAEKPRFVYVGRLTASKGILPMLKIFSKLKGVELQLVGDGELLRELTEQYSRCKNITFMGAVKQSDLKTIYQNACALILPSLAPETFGLSVVEAFAFGTPAIVRHAGGSRELIDATGAGFVYTKDEELAAIVRRISADVDLRVELGRKARQGYLDHYTQNHHIENYLGHIAQIQQARANQTPQS